MKRINLLLFLSIFLVFLGCSSDGETVEEPNPESEEPQQEEPTPDETNSAPNAFALIGIADESMNTELSPSFSWEEATDSDGDNVVYDLYLDDSGNPTTLIVEGLSETEYSFDIRLDYAKEYFWKVVAKDDKGNQTESGVFSFQTVGLFSKAELTNDFPVRTDFSSVVYNGKLWLIGGKRATDRVYYSEDGLTWEFATVFTQFRYVESHTSLVYDDKAWVIGGYYRTSSPSEEVWSSTDVFTWEQATNSAEFGELIFHSSVVFDDKIWVIGGFIYAQIQDGVYNSIDGTSWEKVETMGLPKIGRQKSVVFDDKIWLIGGSIESGRTNGIWNSSDGESWEKVGDGPFSSRYYHSVAVFNNKIWLVGGYDSGSKSFLNDVWSSNDGINWVKESVPETFEARGNHELIEFNGKLWILGGQGDGFDPLSTVWTIN